MEKYIGAKLIEAEVCPAWKGAGGHKTGDPGYRVRYQDGYESWSPKDVFEAAYRRTDGMSFGLAIEAAKMGKKIQRSGWNGKGMFVYHTPVGCYAARTEAAKSIANEDGMVSYGAYLAIKTVSGEVIPWLASQTDMLSDDWRIVD